MARLRRLTLWTAGAVALYAVLGFLVAPPIVRHQLEKALGEQLGRKVVIERVRINPFALFASVHNLALKEADGSADVAGFEELGINVSASSLLRFGVVVEAANLARPYARVVRLEDRSYSFQDIIDRFAAAPPAPQSAPAASPHFAVYNVKVSDGRIDFDDRPAKTQHAVTDIQIGLPFVSSLPKEIDIAVQPRLAARINGAPFELTGETKPFKGTHEATLHLDIDDLELARYLEYAPLPLRVRMPSGTLTTRLVLTSSAGRSGALQTLALSGTASLQRVAIRQTDGGPLIALARLSVDLESLDFIKRRAAVRLVRAEALELDIVRKKDGNFNLQDVAPARPAAPSAKPAAKSDERPFALAIGEVTLQRGQVRFVDRTPEQPARVELNDIALRIEGLSSAPETRADLKLTARINRVSSMEVAGKVNVLSPDVVVDLLAEVRDVDMRPMSPYSVMHAGYPIAKGRFTAKHVIRLEKRTLGTENSIRLDEFTLGEKVDSPTATSLPVALAVAVLKDRNGVIAIDLPVSFSLDKPQASGREIIAREVGGFIDKSAAEPFALLGGDEFAYLEFAPGSAALEADAEAKLRKLAEALDDRPGLQLEVGGRADPGTDSAELKRVAASMATDEEDLRLLAQARAQTVRAWLVGSGKLAAERVSIVAPKMNADGLKDKGKPTRVDFALKGE